MDSSAQSILSIHVWGSGAHDHSRHKITIHSKFPCHKITPKNQQFYLSIFYSSPSTNGDLAAIKQKKKDMLLNKPIYAGMCNPTNLAWWWRAQRDCCMVIVSRLGPPPSQICGVAEPLHGLPLRTCSSTCARRPPPQPAQRTSTGVSLPHTPERLRPDPPATEGRRHAAGGKRERLT